MRKFIKKVLASIQTKRVRAEEKNRKVNYDNNFKLFLQGVRTGF